jgi:hypothetical protein
MLAIKNRPEIKMGKVIEKACPINIKVSKTFPPKLD